MSNRLLLLSVFVLYFMMIGSVYADEAKYCNDGDAPTFSQIREQSYYETSDTQYQLTQLGRDIIQSMQQTQLPYDIYPESFDDDAICAAYLYELSQKLRGSAAPSRFGMFHPQDRTVCSAWELPYCYWYRGGEVISDLGDLYGPQLKKDPTLFMSLVSQEDMLRWFASAWNWKAYLGDLTFVFRESQYLHMIGVYGNYNSHIGKHMGVSEFELTIGELGEYSSNQLMLRTAVGCSYEMWKILEPVWKYIPMKLDERAMRYLGNDTVLVMNEDKERESVSLSAGDQITYSDVMMVHFWEGEKVTGLMEFVCDEEFFPIAVVGINEKLIGKE